MIKNRTTSEIPKPIGGGRNDSVIKLGLSESQAQISMAQKTNNAKLDKLRVKFTRKHNTVEAGFNDNAISRESSD